MTPTVYTLGHSTRSLDELVEILHAHGVTQLVDVRTVPKSRHNPQFNADTFPGALRDAGIDYVHLETLGGLRHTRKDSINTGWRNASFRGYADYMQTEAFERGVERLIALADEAPTAILCAEAVPWRCHRSLIADALSVRGVAVAHLMSATKKSPHAMTSFAKVDGTTITYPAPETDDAAGD